MAALYANKRAWRVRIAQAAVWITFAAIASVMFGPPHPNDTLADHIVGYGGLTFIALCVLGMELYLRLYVLRIEDHGANLRITTLATLHHRTRTVPRADTSFGAERHDYSPAGVSPGVDNTWRTFNVRGQRLPYIVDTTID